MRQRIPQFWSLVQRCELFDDSATDFSEDSITQLIQYKNYEWVYELN